MRLTSPMMTEDDIDRHTTVFDACVADLTSAG